MICGTRCDILSLRDVAFVGKDIETCHRIKEGRAIVKFSTRRKSSELLSKKKKFKNVANDKFTFTLDSKIFINESLCPY